MKRNVILPVLLFVSLFILVAILISADATRYAFHIFPNGERAQVVVPRDSVGNNSIDVFIQDQTTNPVHYYLMREDKADIELASVVTAMDNTVSVSASHGFTGTGEFIVIMEDCKLTQMEVTTVNGNNIVLEQPCSFDYTTDAIVIRGVVDMNVDASTSDSLYQFNLRDCSLPLDIQYIVVTIQDNSEGDDSKFGGGTALDNGVYFYRQNSIISNYGNYCCNQDFREYGITTENPYTDKAGGGNYSMNFEINIKDKYGVVLRLDPGEGDVFKLVVRDDISGLLRFRVALLGQYTLNE